MIINDQQALATLQRMRAEMFDAHGRQNPGKRWEVAALDRAIRCLAPAPRP